MRGAAYLYSLLKIKVVHAKIISKIALETLEKYYIQVTYDELVE